MIAEFLGCVHASVVVAVEPRDGGLRVRRELEGGVTETLDLQMPCLLTIQLGLNQPRYASLKGIMAAKKKEVRTMTPAAPAAPRQRIVALYVPGKSKQTRMIGGGPADAAKELVKLLREEARVLP
jgi:electron transfer flavoprotein beta subunit